MDEAAASAIAIGVGGDSAVVVTASTATAAVVAAATGSRALTVSPARSLCLEPPVERKAAEDGQAVPVGHRRRNARGTQSGRPPLRAGLELVHGAEEEARNLPRCCRDGGERDCRHQRPWWRERRRRGSWWSWKGRRRRCSRRPWGGDDAPLHDSGRGRQRLSARRARWRQ